MTYDDENRLTRYETTNATRIDYSYDARSRLRKRLQSSYTGGTWSATQTNIFIYDGMSIIEDRETSALVPTTTYIRGTLHSQALDVTLTDVRQPLLRTDVKLKGFNE
jgi:YD repeat-containing protein